MTRYRRFFSAILAICGPKSNRSMMAADVGRKAVDIAVEVRRELVGVVQQSREIELGEVVERVAR